jgi:hypothetical protein
MKKQLIGLGLAASLAVGGCGGDSGERGEQPRSDAENPCMDNNGYTSLERSTRFIMKSCQSLGQTEFQEGDQNEADQFMGEWIDQENGAALLCLYSLTFDRRGSITTDCNWDAYNAQVAEASLHPEG